MFSAATIITSMAGSTYRAVEHPNGLLSFLNIRHCNKPKTPAPISNSIINNLHQNSTKNKIITNNSTNTSRKTMETPERKSSNLRISHSTRLAENLRQLGRSHRIRQVPHVEPPSVTSVRPCFPLWLFLSFFFFFKQFCLWVLFFIRAFIAFFDFEDV